MSKQNLDLVRSIYDAWGREESAREYIAEDIEYVNPSYAVEPGTRRGRRSLGLVRDTYGDFKVRPVQFLEAGADGVVVLAFFEASGSASGVPVSGEHGYIWTVRAGQAVRFRWFHSHQEALDAAGLTTGDP